MTKKTEAPKNPETKTPKKPVEKKQTTSHEEKPLSFKGELVEVIVHKKLACIIQMEVKASSALAKKARDLAVKKVGKDVIIPGFRKGKAPASLLEKQYSSSIEKQWHTSLGQLAFFEAQKLAKTPVLNGDTKVNFDLKSHSLEGAELNFSFETEPVISLANPKDFTIKKIKKVEIGEKQIDEATRQMLLFYATWNTVEDRPVQEKDYILIDLETLDTPPKKVFSDTRFYVADDNVAQWMKKLVIGMKTGETKEGVSSPDKDLPEKEKKEFSPKKVRLTIKKIETAILPELNDEFAQKVGAKTAEEVRASVTTRLREQVDHDADRQLRQQVNDFLLKHCTCELPRSLINAEVKHRIEQMENDPKQKKQWDSLSKEEKEKAFLSIHNHAEEAVRLFYISRKVIQEANLPVKQDEIQTEAIATLQAHGIFNIDQKKIPQELYALSLSKVLLRKAQDYVIENSKV